VALWGLCSSVRIPCRLPARGRQLGCSHLRIVDSEECPTVSLSNKFPLADASEYSGAQKGSFAGELAEQLKTLSSEIKSKRGKTHSSDEGLA
jgi:hypothetical protein